MSRAEIQQIEDRLQRRDLAGALDLAMSVRHELPEAWGMVARVRLAQGDRSGARDAALAWVERVPQDSAAWEQLGRTMLAIGAPEEAVSALRQAVRIEASSTRLTVLGQMLRRVGRPTEARHVLDRAVAMDAQDVRARLGRATLSSWRGDDASALVDLEYALRLRPASIELLGAQAAALRGLGRLDESLAVLRSARADAPDDVRLAWNEALTLLAAGRFQDGFQAYEVRRRRARQRGAIAVDGVPFWRGEDVAGKVLLVQAEQGFGDTLQFVRFVPRLAALGATVVVRGHPRLAMLVGTVDGVSEYQSKEVPVATCDFQIGLMDVPGILGLGEADLADAVPYLSAEVSRREVWRAELPSSGFRVGVGWQGNPDFEADHLRSPPLSSFAPLARVEGTHFVCLQQRHGREQLIRSPINMLDLAPRLDLGDAGFVDTAAVIEELDLVVTSDTALAHLAGGLGCPVWVVLPFAADWRWLVARSDSPWYPTMRLFRQSSPGDWDGVFGRVAAALRDRVAQRR